MRTFIICVLTITLMGCGKNFTFGEVRVEHVIPPRGMLVPVTYPILQRSVDGVVLNADHVNYTKALERELKIQSGNHSTYIKYIDRLEQQR